MATSSTPRRRNGLMWWTRCARRRAAAARLFQHHLLAAKLQLHLRRRRKPALLARSHPAGAPQATQNVLSHLPLTTPDEFNAAVAAYCRAAQI